MNREETIKTYERGTHLLGRIVSLITGEKEARVTAVTDIK